MDLRIEENQADDDEHAIGFDAGEGHGRTSGEKIRQNPATVQRRNWNEIEDHQQDVNQNGIARHHGQRHDEHADYIARNGHVG